MSNQTLKYNQRVHAAHCCKHGCKYGEKDCPVAGGTVMQLYSCTNLQCDESDGETSRFAQARAVVQALLDAVGNPLSFQEMAVAAGKAFLEETK